MAARSPAPAPPNFRDAAEGAAKRCGSCHMFDSADGVCWGFGNYPTSADKVCDAWAAEPDETKSARGGHAMTDVQTPEGDATPEADRAGRRAGASDETRALREEMRGVREARRVPISQFEIREVPNGSGGTNLEFEGYASVTCSDEEDLSHSYEMEDWCGPYEESVLRGAFTKTLAENADVAFLVNHGAGGGVTMARTKPGTLKLFEDLVGLHVAATLNPARSDVQILKAAVADGALDEMSFAFRVVRQKWSWAEDNGVIDRRFMQELNLDKGDVSPVNYGANPHTGGLVSMRSAMTLLNGRGLNFETLAAALREIRAGATISQATRDVLQPILNHLASIDEMVDTDQADLSGLLGVANPDEDDDGDSEAESAPEAEKLAAPVYVLPDHTARAWADLAEMRRR
jgi:uncharacterized protein